MRIYKSLDSLESGPHFTGWIFHMNKCCVIYWVIEDPKPTTWLCNGGRASPVWDLGTINRTARKVSSSVLPFLAYIWMLCRNLDVTFRKDAFEQSSAHSVELEQGGKDSDLHQMKNKVHDVWPEEVVQEDYYQHQILAGIEILFTTWRVELEQWA